MKHLLTTLLAIIMVFSMAVFVSSCGESESSDESASVSDEPAAGAEASVQGLDFYMGGWGVQSQETEVRVVSFFEEDGLLRIEMGAIPGGGIYMTFEPDDITINGDTMTCVNGNLVTDGPNSSDCIFYAEPSVEVPGAYRFRYTSEEAGIQDDYSTQFSYTKVAETQEELDAWISENTGL